MRSINVSTDVYAKIWTLRQEGEDTEDGILRRLLGCGAPRNKIPQPTLQRSAVSPVLGFHDRRFDVHFEEGFEIFRNYLGTDYRARASGGYWLLTSDGKRYGSLNELSHTIGARTENAWMNWHFLGHNGERTPVSELRDPSKIGRRRRGQQRLAPRPPTIDELLA